MKNPCYSLSTPTCTKLFVAISVLLLSATVHGEDWVQENGVDPCKDNGQCHSMMRGYETLIEGEGCRSFFSTGKCARICAYSLKSLITRRAWNRCAHRCEWATSVTDAAASWLEMCLSRPADEPSVEDEASDNQSGTGNNASTHINENQAVNQAQGLLYRVFHFPSSMQLSSKGKSRSVFFRMLRLFYWFQVMSITVFLIGFLAVLAVSVRSNTPISVVISHFMKRLEQWRKQAVKQIRKIAPRSISKLSLSRAQSLPTAFSRSSSTSKQSIPDRRELSSLQRGARRHLKAMHANLD